MAERSGIAWELGLENAPPPLISMQENSGRLRGKYVKAQGAKAAEFSLGKNEWRQVCENLAEEKEAPSSILIDKEKNFPEMPSEPKASAKKTPWLWIAAGAAVAAGGFIAWRATRPNHHYIMME